jgi:hypothetical protein
MAPPKARKSRKIPVGCNQFASGLNCQSGEKGVWDQIPGCLRITTQLAEYVPVSGTWSNDYGIWPGTYLTDKRQRLVKRGRRIKYPRVSDHSEAAAEHGV